MRNVILVLGCLAVLMLVTALPVAAGSGDLLGSGASAPENGQPPAPAVESAAGAADTTAAVGEDVLAATRLDSGATLWLGLGLVAAGGAGVAASRRTRRQ